MVHGSLTLTLLSFSLQGDSIRHAIGQSLGYSDGLRGNPLYSPHGLNVSLTEKKLFFFLAERIFITEENAWMIPTKFWRQTDSNPHQKLWCKSALVGILLTHICITHTPSHVVGRNNLFAAGLLESFTQTWSNRRSMSRQRGKLRLSLGEVMRFCKKANINEWIHINIHTCTHGAVCWDRKQMRSISIFQNASNNTTTCKALGSIYVPSYWTTLLPSLSLSERICSPFPYHYNKIWNWNCLQLCTDVNSVFPDEVW